MNSPTALRPEASSWRCGVGFPEADSSLGVHSDLNGKKYLVSLFGERAWVKNARAAHGEAFHHPWRSVDEFTFVRSLSTSELPIDPGVERLLI